MYVFQHCVPLVVVNNFGFNRIRVLPYKADPPLIIDPYAALSAPIASELKMDWVRLSLNDLITAASITWCVI